MSMRSYPKWIVAFLTVSLSIVSASCTRSIEGGFRPLANATKDIKSVVIFITPLDRDWANCVATATPGRIRVHKSQEIEWSVVDFCNATNGYSTETLITNWSGAATTAR